MGDPAERSVPPAAGLGAEDRAADTFGFDDEAGSTVRPASDPRALAIERRESWRPLAVIEAAGRYGRYELLGRVARGGMAEILLARERTVGASRRLLVVKRILPEAAGDDQFVRMFLNEGRLVMGLAHPSLCHVYDVGREGDTWFIAMEWVNGAPLSRVVRRARRTGGLPPPLVARIIAHVADALHHAHRARDEHGTPLGIVHRDVTPHNIMIAYDGAVKLLDFGIAKARGSFDRTQAGVVKGKFAYMAPEQCLRRPIDARTDVFALGICLWEALSGRSLYRRPTEYETLDAILHEDAPPLDEIDPDLPPALCAIASRALRKDPAERFASAGDMQLALEQELARTGHVVSTARVADLMAVLFEEEIRKGPELEPIALPPTTLAQPDSDEVDTAEGNAPRAGPAVLGGLPPQAFERDALDEPSSFDAAPATRGRTVRRLLVVAAVALLVALVPVAVGELGETGPSPSGPAASVEPPAAPAPARPLTGTDEPGSVTAPAPPGPADAIAALDPGGQPARVERAPRSARRPPAREPAGTARLSINTRPWSKVYVRGRFAGNTPIGAVSVPSGRVVLRLVDRDGRVHHRSVRLDPGQHAERFFDLSAE